MKHKLLWFVTALPAFITIVVMPYMDEKVPMHYDINGTIDRYGSKYENFIFPVIIFCLTLFWLCFLTYFKKKEQKSTSEKEAAQAKSNGTIIYVTATAMAIMLDVYKRQLKRYVEIAAHQHTFSLYIDIIYRLLV